MIKSHYGNFWIQPKYHVMENHTMENHVMEGITVDNLDQLVSNFQISNYCVRCNEICYCSTI